MRLKIILLSIILVEIPARIFSESGKVIGDFVNFRKAASSNSEVISVLQKGAVISILDEVGQSFFIDEHWGKWLKVATPSNSVGYVFSAFVQRSSDRSEPFHLFFNKLTNLMVKERTNETKALIIFPLKYEAIGSGGNTNFLIPASNFGSLPSRFRANELGSDVDEKGNPKVHFVIEGCLGYSIYFVSDQMKWRICKFVYVYD